MNIKFNIYSTLFFCFFLILPFIYSSQIIDPVLIPRQIWLTIFVFIIGSIISCQIYFKKISADFSFIKLVLPLLFIGFSILTIASFKQSIAITESIYELSKTLIGVLFFMITTFLLIQKKINIEQLIKSIITLNLIVLVFAFFQLVIVKENIVEINSTMANKNLLSSFLFLTLPFLFISIALSKPWKIFATILILLTLVLLWILQSKAVILASLVFLSLLFLLIFFRYSDIKINKRFSNILFITTTSIIILATIISIQKKEYFPHLFNTNTVHTRLSLWENSEQMIKENLIFGVGAGNWKIHFPKYGLNQFDKKVRNGLSVYQRPHNEFLKVLSELGIAGLLLFLSFFLVPIYYLFRILNNTKDNKDVFLPVTFLSFIIGFILVAAVDFPLERIEHQVLLYLLFAIIVSNYYSTFKEQNTLPKNFVKLPIFILAITSITFLSFIVCINRYSGEYHTVKIYNAKRNVNWKKVIFESNKAINPFYTIDPMASSIEWYKGVAYFTLGDINEAMKSFEKAYALTPYNIHVLNNLGSCHESIGDHKNAKKYYLEALKISSNFEETLLNLTAVYYNTKEYEKAFNTINKCNINSTDIKYKTFLPVILNAKIDLIISGLKDQNIKKSILNLKETDDLLLQFYLDAKKENVNYDIFLREYAFTILENHEKTTVYPQNMPNKLKN